MAWTDVKMANVGFKQNRSQAELLWDFGQAVDDLPNILGETAFETPTVEIIEAFESGGFRGRDLGNATSAEWIVRILHSSYVDVVGEKLSLLELYKRAKELSTAPPEDVASTTQNSQFNQVSSLNCERDQRSTIPPGQNAETTASEGKSELFVSNAEAAALRDMLLDPKAPNTNSERRNESCAVVDDSKTNFGAVVESNEDCSVVLSKTGIPDEFIRENIDNIDLKKLSFLVWADNYGERYFQLNHEAFATMVRHGKTSEVLSCRSQQPPWQCSMAPYVSVREYALYRPKNFCGLNKHLDSNDTYRAHLEAAEHHYTAESVGELFRLADNRLNEIRPSNDGKTQRQREMAGNYDSQIESARAQAFAVSALYCPWHAHKCSRALLDILDKMNPASLKEYPKIGMNGNFTRPDLIRKVFSNVVYYKGLNRAARKVIDHLENGPKQGAHVFEDLRQSFLDVGESEASAYDKTWDILGLFAIGGTATGGMLVGLAGESATEFGVALQTLALGMNVLDGRLANRGLQYSLPPNVKKTFDTGKPYHFWMAGFLAREQAIKTGSKQAGKYAACIANIGYQMKVGTVGRVPSRAFMETPLSHSNNKLRFDMLYAGAGAKFGAESIDEPYDGAIPLDDAFKRMVKKSALLEPLSEAEAKKHWSGLGIKGFRRWGRILKPDVILDL